MIRELLSLAALTAFIVNLLVWASIVMGVLS